MEELANSCSFQQLYEAPNQSSKVLLYQTGDGSCVLKRWLAKRVRIGGNRSQPLAEYAALLDLQDVPNINTPIKITLESTGADIIYVYCGSDALRWRAKLQKELEDDEQCKQQAEQLAQHVAVHVLLALQEMSNRGLVHRDVKPSNILLTNIGGFTWLSDMGLISQAKHLPGFVKGLDLSYIPPEYIVHNSNSNTHIINDDLPVLAQLTTTAADMYQLGLTVYQLIHGSLPSFLKPKKGASSSPERLSGLLQRVATFDWRREIANNIANSDAAELLEALLQKDPALRPTPQEALQFAWLKPVLQPALQLLEQQRQQWPVMQQQALLAAKHMELQQIQQDIASLTAAAAAAPGYSEGRSNTSTSNMAPVAPAPAGDSSGWDSGGAAADSMKSRSAAQRSHTSALWATAFPGREATAAIVDMNPAAMAEAWGAESSSGDEAGGAGRGADGSSTSAKAACGNNSSSTAGVQSAAHAAVPGTTARATETQATAWEQQQQQQHTTAGICSDLEPGVDMQHDGW